MHRNLRCPARRYREDLGNGNPVLGFLQEKLDETLVKAEEDIPSAIAGNHRLYAENP